MIPTPITRLWRDQRVRFLVVGGFNTGSSLIVSWAVFFLLSQRLHFDARITGEIASVICTVINVTVAFVGYKFVVFRTRGNSLHEYLRFYIVYAIPITAGLVLQPVLMTFIQKLYGSKFSFYIATALITGGTVIISYHGHKRVTFRQKHSKDVSSTPATEPSRYPTSH